MLKKLRKNLFLGNVCGSDGRMAPSAVMRQQKTAPFSPPKVKCNKVVTTETTMPGHRGPIMSVVS